MLIDFASRLGPWSWIILAAILFAIEIFAPGTFILWLGIAATIVGVLGFAIGWGWQAQFIAFAILAPVAVITWWYLARGRKEEHPDRLNHRAQNQIGSEFILDAPILNGVGRVRIGDSNWRISGPDCPAGTRVRVERADGALLVVAPVP